MLEFNSWTEKASFQDPSEGEVNEIEIEIREDPLTGKTSRILDKSLPSPDNPDMSDVEKGSFCPFCPETISDVGARDTRVLSGEKMERNEAVLLANVTPYAEHSLVIRLSEDHYQSLDDFRKEQFYDGFKLTKEYLKKMDLTDEIFPVIIMNYLKPAGSSVVHPHMQLLVSDKLLDYQRRLIENAEKFYEENGENYWKRLLEHERRSDRIIGDTGEFEWISAFAPRGFDHVKGISMDSFTEFSKGHLQSLSEGIVKVLEAYSAKEQTTFNFSLFILPSRREEKFATVIDMVTRSKLDKFYRADDFAMPKLLDESYSNKKPEELAEEIDPYF